jgi:hypothetical protein
MVAFGLACSGGHEGRGVPASGAKPGEAALAPVHGAGGHESAQPGDPDGAPVSEAEARTILAARFRAAGFRVRHDVRVAGNGFELTVDGYDPESRVGFEYIAPDERDTDLVAEERAHLAREPTYRILILDPMSAPAVEAHADAFLAGVRP